MESVMHLDPAPLKNAMRLSFHVFKTGKNGPRTVEVVVKRGRPKMKNRSKYKPHCGMKERAKNKQLYPIGYV